MRTFRQYSCLLPLQCVFGFHIKSQGNKATIAKTSKWHHIKLQRKEHQQNQMAIYRLTEGISKSYVSVQFSSVAQSCPTLCDPVNRSMPGLFVHHQLSEFSQTHVHWVSYAIQPSHPLSSPSPAPIYLIRAYYPKIHETYNSRAKNTK